MSCPTLGDTIAAVWAQRVVSNGGARPSQATIDAAAVFYDALKTAGIASKMKAVNLFVPDGLVAAQTPFIKTTGSDPWVNVNFVSGDVSTSGLKGDGTTKLLRTGCIPSTMFPNDSSAGISVYTLGASSDAWESMSATNFVGADFGIAVGIGNVSYFDAFGSSEPPNRCSAANAGWQGFLSGSRTTSSRADLYKASGVSAFANIDTTTGTQTGGINGRELYAFGFNETNTQVAQSARYMSFLAYHLGLSSSETQALYNAVQAYRIAIGGGYV